MNEPNVPVQSLKTLIISSFCAVFLALIILVTVIGPAEYGIDPTGFGKAMGLTILAKTKPQNNKSVELCPSDESSNGWKDIVVITVPANSGLEYKFNVKKDAELGYTWATDGTALYFDFHGEPEGDTSGYFKSFKESTDSQSEGVLTAPFSGSHGWYWKNTSKNPVRVTLKTRGEYLIKGLM